MDSFIAWVGGKKLLRKEIVARFPTDFKRYVEVFGGAAWVLFHKEPNQEEVYNDINGELVNLFRCAKHHPEAIEREFDFILNSRDEFGKYKNQNAETLTDIQRAAGYLYLIKMSYGSKTKHYGTKFRELCSVEKLKEISERLRRVVIEHKNFPELIKRYDNTETLFYLDPPYHGTEGFYDTGEFVFDESQHMLLRDILTNIKGKFILSYNDDEFIRELYKDFNIEEISRASNLAMAVKGNANKVFKELIIKNY